VTQTISPSVRAALAAPPPGARAGLNEGSATAALQPTIATFRALKTRTFFGGSGY